MGTVVQTHESSIILEHDPNDPVNDLPESYVCCLLAESYKVHRSKKLRGGLDGRGWVCIAVLSARYSSRELTNNPQHVSRTPFSKVYCIQDSSWEKFYGQTHIQHKPYFSLSWLVYNPCLCYPKIPGVIQERNLTLPSFPNT